MTIEREILDPILRQALDEIEAVLKRHAIAGNILVASSTHAAFRLHFPEWSGVRLEGPGRIRIKLKSADQEHANASVHLLLSLRDLSLRQALSVDNIADVVMKQLEAEGATFEHKPFGGDDPEATT